MCKMRRLGVFCLQRCVVYGLLAGSLSAADPPMLLPIRVTSETVPAGGFAQIKFFIDAPTAITSGSVKANFDPAVFDTVRFVSVFSATGDAYGSAEPKGNTVNILFQSPSGGLGRSPDLPVLTIQVPVRAGIPNGTNSTAQFSVSTTAWQGLAGATFTPQFSAASVTVGAAVSMARLHPGAGLLPAGTIVAVEGTGFKPGTMLQVAGVASGPVIFLDTTHLQLPLLASADLQGKHVTIYNPGEPVIDFYPDLQGAVDDTVKTFQPIFPKQQFSNSYLGGLLFAPTAIAVQNTQLVPVDINFHTEILNNPSLNRKVILASGATLIRNFDEVSANLVRASLYLQTSLPVSAVREAAYSDRRRTSPAIVVKSYPPPPPTPPRQDPGYLTFLAVKDSAPPLEQFTGVYLCTPNTFSVETDSGGNWLSLVLRTPPPFMGITGFVAEANPSSLDVGTYRGRFEISCGGAIAKKEEVLLQVIPTVPQLNSDNPAITLAVAAIADSAETNFTISSQSVPSDFLIASDSPWLLVPQSVSSAIPVPFHFTAPQIVTVTATASNLDAGTYQATLTINPAVPGLALPLTLPVTFTVASSIPRPQLGPPLPVTVVNAASGISGPIAPGEILTVFGLNLGPDFPYTFSAADAPSPPAEVGGAAILFDGTPGLILFTSPTQVNVLVPPSLASSAQAVSVEAKHAGLRASAGSYPLVAAVPGIFAINNQDGSRNTALNPAAPGSTLQVLTTGITFAPNASLTTKAGAFTFPTSYTVPAPGQFAGQVTFTLPPELPAGEAELLLAVNFTGLRAASFPLFIGPSK